MRYINLRLLTYLLTCDDCQRRVPISCVRRQACDPWLTLTTVGESGDGALPEPLPDVGCNFVLRTVDEIVLDSFCLSTAVAGAGVVQRYLVIAAFKSN